MRITVIGAANIDIITKSKAKIIPGDSNPAEVSLSAGGVARNIAENLARHGAEVSLITAVGNDPFGELLKEKCAASGVNTDAWIIKQNMSTGVYLAALDSDGELHAAFNAMTAPELIKANDLAKYRVIIREAGLLIMDTNMTEKTLAAALELRGERPVMVDAVSVAKVQRVGQMLPDISLLKLNRLEAECLTGITLDTKERVKQACFDIVNRGVRRVFITLGMAGACAADKNNAIFVPALPVAVKDVTGAGDAFAAGVALRFEEDLRTQAEYGVELAAQYLKARI